MQLHSRTLTVQSARGEIAVAIGTLAKKHQLTGIELVQILNSVQADYIKYLLRDERHPDDPDKPADEA